VQCQISVYKTNRALNLITRVNFRGFIKINKLNVETIVKKRENVRTKNIFNSNIFTISKLYI
jgi:hypothetical protein